MIDLRFPTALQIMLSLALAEEEGVAVRSSASLAEGLGANPSFVRKLLVPLVRDGFVASTNGRNGGVCLARPAAEITLRDVYGSVTDDKKLWISRADVPHACVVSSNIGRYFDSLAAEAENAVLCLLGERTLASSLRELRLMDAAAA